MGTGGSTHQFQIERSLYEARQRNRNLLIPQITNEIMKKCIQEVLRSNIELANILRDKINQQEDFTIALNGSYRGQRQREFIQSGFGELISDNQDKYYLGNWNHNKLKGLGCIIILKDNEYQYYCGQLFEGMAHGQGKIQFSDGSWYKGNWEAGEITGEGQLYISNKLLYEGNLSDSKMHGKGKLILYGNYQPGSSDRAIIENGGLILSGLFQEDQMIEGTVQSQNGNYKGQMRDGKMEGKGRFMSKDGGFYDGEFKNNQRHGIGKFLNQQGKVEVGLWKNDQLENVLQIQ